MEVILQDSKDEPQLTVDQLVAEMKTTAGEHELNARTVRYKYMHASRHTIMALLEEAVRALRTAMLHSLSLTRVTQSFNHDIS